MDDDRPDVEPVARQDAGGGALERRSGFRWRGGRSGPPTARRIGQDEGGAQAAGDAPTAAGLSVIWKMTIRQRPPGAGIPRSGQARHRSVGTTGSGYGWDDARHGGGVANAAIRSSAAPTTRPSVSRATTSTVANR